MNSKTPLWLPSPRKFQGFQDLSASYGERPNVCFLPEEGPLTVPSAESTGLPAQRPPPAFSRVNALTAIMTCEDLVLTEP